MKRMIWLMMVSVVLAGLAGCSTEPRTVTIHEPGAYKGMKDPLLARQQQDQVLVDRFKLVQTDR
ncbi:MAG TPA: hypothetical protein VMB77_06615 [Syntrophales bacterium]|nr:hypothetical protein [Syntrophales bacterium]